MGIAGLPAHVTAGGPVLLRWPCAVAAAARLAGLTGLVARPPDAAQGCLRVGLAPGAVAVAAVAVAVAAQADSSIRPLRASAWGRPCRVGAGD